MSSRSPSRKVSVRKPLRRPDHTSLLTQEKKHHNEHSPTKACKEPDQILPESAPPEENSVEDNLATTLPPEKRHKSRKQKKESLSPSHRIKRKHDSQVPGEEIPRKRKRDKKLQKSVEPEKYEIDGPREVVASLSELDERLEESRHDRPLPRSHREYTRSEKSHAHASDAKFGRRRSISRSPSMSRHSSHLSESRTYHSPSPERKQWSREKRYMRPPTSGGIYRPPAVPESAPSTLQEDDSPTRSSKWKRPASPEPIRDKCARSAKCVELQNDKRRAEGDLSPEPIRDACDRKRKYVDELHFERRAIESEKLIKKASVSSSSSRRTRDSVSRRYLISEDAGEKCLLSERPRLDERDRRRESREKYYKSHQTEVVASRGRNSKSPKSSLSKLKSRDLLEEPRTKVRDDRESRLSPDRYDDRVVRSKEKESGKQHRNLEKRHDLKKYRSRSRSVTSSRSPAASSKSEHTLVAVGTAASSTTSKRAAHASPSKFPSKRDLLPKQHTLSAVNNSLTSLVGMLDLEETSDMEFIDLLPEGVVSGETAKLSLPPRVPKKGVPAVPSDGGDQLKKTRIPECGEAVEPREADSPSKKPPDTDTCDTSGLYGSLSTQLQQKLMSAETWDDGVDAIDLELLSEDSLARKSDQILDPEEVATMAASSAMKDIICLASASASLLSTQRKLLSSLSTPWQEIDAGCEEKETISSYSSITEKTIGLRTLALTGFSRRYMGESLTKELEAKLTTSGPNNGQQIADYDLDNSFALPSSSSTMFGSIFSRHPIALFHRRCVINRLDPVSSDPDSLLSGHDVLSTPPRLPAIPPTQFLSQCNHSKVLTMLGELALRRHLLCLTSC